MTGRLVTIDEIESFKAVRDFPVAAINEQPLVQVVRNLDEREQLEPFIRAILSDSNQTPHGPVEIADILTHKVNIGGDVGSAAFILKGKSFSTVRLKDVSHQIFKLERIDGLKFAFFGASGRVLDEVKENFFAVAERLGWIYAIFDAIDLARLFAAYGFLCPRDGRRIAAGKCPKCGYSPARRVLNIFQEEALRMLGNSHELQQRAGLLVLPPGSGKTRVAAEDARRTGAVAVLFIAHTHEILDVANSEFSAVFGADSVGRLDGRRVRPKTQVSLSTIQHLASNASHIRSDTYDYVVVDEFHHAAAPSYRQVIERLQPKYLLGLTATPYRGDKQDIGELCEGNVLASFDLRSGIDSGILCPYHYFGCFDDIDYTNLQLDGTRYDVRDLERALIVPARDRAVIRKWREHADGRPSLAFCCSQRHADRVAEHFTQQGVPAESYTSRTEWSVRQEMVQMLLEGELKVLCVVDIMNEGADLPFVDCLLFLRPTESQRVYYQQLGRGLRKYVGKSHCTVIDFIGNFHNAYKIVEYQSLDPVRFDKPNLDFGDARNIKDVLTLPLGCEVHFDERVIDVFAQQTLDAATATRHNIGRMLVYQFRKLEKRLGRRPTRIDVHRGCLLDESFYKQVFGSWEKFERVIEAEDGRFRQKGPAGTGGVF